ncbi:hypothetical protein M747DRAFT_301726 [Aspergillus niger ATCC 13496]|uniref:BTB domain-containing protein n=1 Tax=Aspergillus niger ATCC 13496 TaxID=1353008 RepID=A0A370CAH7_ASPNG|nr:hypothetical protein CBS11232_118 [Aspergillus niger]RDH24774.1 hypothetical protein M747DRAFT_301726 [Aspergillus niger ATCC 13496]
MALEPTTPPEDGMAKQPVNPSIPELKEYAQVAECPYTTPIITFKVNDSYYNIPQNYLRPFDSLQFDPQSVHAFFSGEGYHHELNVHPEVAHTFVHYLYTGQYETLETQFEPPQSVDDIPALTKARDSIEFERAAYVYEAAVQYEIPGLLNMAQAFMARFAERLPIANILRGIRCVYGNLLEQSSGCMWLEDFVREQLSIAFSSTDGKLRHIMKEYEVGNSKSFDHFVVDEVLALYEEEQDRIHHVKSLANSGEEHGPMLQSEPPYEPAFEPEPEPEPEIKAPEIPDSPLYKNWHTLSSKDRKKREKVLIKNGLPIPGKDFELPVPNDEPPPEAEPELPAEPEPEPVPMSSSSFGSWDMPVASNNRLVDISQPVSFGFAKWGA